MNRALLFIVLLPAALYERMGADLPQLRAILHVRLLMDDRKPRAVGQRLGRARKPARFSSVLSAVFSLATGIVYLIPLQLSDAALGLTLYYTVFLCLLSFSLITDFSNVLLDSRDKYILVPRPVSGRTLFTARLLHIFIYLIRLVLPMALPGWLVFPLLFGWSAALWFPVPVLLLTATALFLVTGAYLLLLRLTSAARFRDWLNGFQIAFSILIFAGYYVGPQIMRSQEILEQRLTNLRWLRFLPSYWIAATWSWRPGTVFLPQPLYYAVAALLIPGLCLFLTLRFLAPGFAARLAAADSAGESQPAASASTGGRRTGIAPRLATLFNRNSEAQAGFLITWYQTGRSRTFRIRVLPSLAYVPLYFIYLLTVRSDGDFSETWRNLPETNQHLTLLYISAFALLQSLNYLILSEQYKASWVYYAAPLAQPGRVIAGGLKAVWVKYYLPFFGFIAGFVLYKWGIDVWMDLLLALVNVSLTVLCLAYFSSRSFPFSRAEQMRQKTGRVLRVLLVMAIPAILLSGHLMAVEQLWLKVLFLILSAMLFWLVWGSYVRTSWQQLAASQALEE